VSVPPTKQADSSSELAIAIKIEKPPEAVYLATSDEIQGLVAETLEIARNVEARRFGGKKLGAFAFDRQAVPELSVRKPLIILR
jgi:hypothetical protein